MQDFVSFKMGSSLEDLNFLNKKNGAIYFISDTGEMYWDIDANKRQKITSQKYLFCEKIAIDFPPILETSSAHLGFLVLGKSLLGDDGGKGEILP